MGLILKLKFYIMICDFVLDWYYFRHMRQDFKETKMGRVKHMRRLLDERLEEELSESDSLEE